MAELYKTVHWRKIKSIYSRIANYENIDINNYDIDNIKCYKINNGDELNRKFSKF